MKNAADEISENAARNGFACPTACEFHNTLKLSCDTNPEAVLHPKSPSGAISIFPQAVEAMPS